MKAELDLQAGRTVAGAPTGAKSKAVTILGDKAIPYRLLRKVMYTAARADAWPVDFLPSWTPGPGHGAGTAHPVAGTTTR